MHALGNILVPLITVIALTYGGLLEGAVLTETVFAWPGLGHYITTRLFNADMNAVLGGTLVVGVVFIGLNMLSDLLYRCSIRGRGCSDAPLHLAPTAGVTGCSSQAPASRAPGAARPLAIAPGSRFCRNPLAMVGLVDRAGCWSLMALFAPLIADRSRRHRAGPRGPACSRRAGEHWFGTDELGRDIYAPRASTARASR